MALDKTTDLNHLTIPQAIASLESKVVALQDAMEAVVALANALKTTFNTHAHGSSSDVPKVLETTASVTL